MRRSSLHRIEAEAHGLQSKLTDLQGDRRKIGSMVSQGFIEQKSALQTLQARIGDLHTHQQQSGEIQDERLTR